MNGTNVLLENIVVSAKLSKQPDGENWVQNTDGLGMYRHIFSLLTNKKTVSSSPERPTDYRHRYHGRKPCPGHQFHLHRRR